ncbi:probable G-protein coupled receptor 21 [Paramacrobiotus metropolitanus]|uniref:probable G-protein coupled receptor 21 n=1 Tax=Paramacrobiotus metropolitanus TaxID=2943436 RepID=UPI0024463922|nr:probable G-protein coupled receptor 21 [Paramacrobiotus metropolitanus]
MNATNATLNDTETVTFVAATFIGFLALAGNLLVMMVFIHNKFLHSTFAICLTVLLASNILYCFTSYLIVLSDHFGNIILPEKYSCAFFEYVNWVIAGIPMNLHVLLSTNRIWAMYFPLSYRRCTKWTALWLVLATLAYVHLTCLPVVIQDVLFNPIVTGCTDRKYVFSTVIIFAMLTGYAFPVIFMAVSALLLWIRQRQFEKRHRTGFRVLLALTVSVWVCWIPYGIYYILEMFDGDYNALLDIVFAMLYNVQGIFDPLLVICSMKEVRLTLKKWFSKKNRQAAKLI